MDFKPTSCVYGRKREKEIPNETYFVQYYWWWILFLLIRQYSMGKQLHLYNMGGTRTIFTTAQKMKFSNKYFFRKCDHIRLHLLKKFLMKNFNFCVVHYNLEQNICIILPVLAKFLFTTSETELDYNQ